MSHLDYKKGTAFFGKAVNYFWNTTQIFKVITCNFDVYKMTLLSKKPSFLFSHKKCSFFILYLFLFYVLYCCQRYFLYLNPDSTSNILYNNFQHYITPRLLIYPILV